mmetsp:Transcript_13302/g.28880  ORF Transcript_13302/g.28880 Transcript_13302/m.28880 type:complete len:203 (+) Transcript_13302:500-1108(+)
MRKVDPHQIKGHCNRIANTWAALGEPAAITKRQRNAWIALAKVREYRAIRNHMVNADFNSLGCSAVILIDCFGVHCVFQRGFVDCEKRSPPSFCEIGARSRVAGIHDLPVMHGIVKHHAVRKRAMLDRHALEPNTKLLRKVLRHRLLGRFKLCAIKEDHFQPLTIPTKCLEPRSQWPRSNHNHRPRSLPRAFQLAANARLSR